MDVKASSTDATTTGAREEAKKREAIDTFDTLALPPGILDYIDIIDKAPKK